MSTKYKNYLENILSSAKYGKITITLPDGNVLYFEAENQDLECDLTINSWKTVDLIIKRGDIGLGEAYHEGYWDSKDPAKFLEYCSLNLDHFENNGNGSFLSRMMFLFYNQILRLNTRKGSKKNILQHYDISNDFYKLWLDPTMTYSSALRVNNNDTLESAQNNKYQRIADELNIENKTVLEIGCGWGGFLEYANQFNAETTGVTISNKQFDFAKKRLKNQSNVLLMDYRDINKKYDRIVSIEMFEAVGEKYWPVYFNKIKNSLSYKGKALIQTITIKHDYFNKYRKNSDYIRHHIFPGGMLPSKEVFCSKAIDAGLKIGNIIEFGSDYAWTLKEWRNNFNNVHNELLEMGYNNTFIRTWLMYLNICIAGFESQRTNVMQVELIN